jgi:DNA-directed RNA polymerase specialized sigma24 family protein
MSASQCVGTFITIINRRFISLLRKENASKRLPRAAFLRETVDEAGEVENSLDNIPSRHGSPQTLESMQATLLEEARKFWAPESPGFRVAAGLIEYAPLGYTNVEIAEMIGMSYTSFNVTSHRIKKKFAHECPELQEEMEYFLGDTGQRQSGVSHFF